MVNLLVNLAPRVLKPDAGEGQVVYTEDHGKIAIHVPIVPLLVVAASES